MNALSVPHGVKNMSPKRYVILLGAHSGSKAEKVRKKRGKCKREVDRMGFSCYPIKSRIKRAVEVCPKYGTARTSVTL